MMLNLPAIAERPLFVATMALALIATKTLVIALIGLAFRMKWRSAFALGVLMSQVASSALSCSPVRRPAI